MGNVLAVPEQAIVIHFMMPIDVSSMLKPKKNPKPYWTHFGLKLSKPAILGCKDQGLWTNEG